MVMHHAISDGWSVGVLIRELSALYESFRLGQPSPLPEPAVQYADYAVWERNRLQGDSFKARLEYWRERLAGVPPLDLPTDLPRPPVSSQRGGTRSAIVPNSTLEQLRSLGRREGATLYMSLLAIFQVLLHRYAGQDDIAVGSPVAGRTQPELEGLIGFFVNTLVLRGDLSGDPSFREFLRRFRRAALEAFAHQDVPFDQLVALLQSGRDTGRSPLFQVMFALQNVPMPPLQAPDLVLEPLDLSSSTAKFDLSLFATERADGLRLTLEYCTDLFDAATVDRMLAHYRAVLDGIIADPDQPISAISMLGLEEGRQLSTGGNSDACCDWEAEIDETGMADLHSPPHEFFHLELATDE